MKKLSVCLAMVLVLSGCATRRIQIGKDNQIVFDDRVRDAFDAKFSDIDTVLKSDLPAEQKAQIVEKIMEKRLEALKELLLREADRGKNAMQTFKEILMFSAALMGVAWR